MPAPNARVGRLETSECVRRKRQSACADPRGRGACGSASAASLRGSREGERGRGMPVRGPVLRSGAGTLTPYTHRRGRRWPWPTMAVADDGRGRPRGAVEDPGGRRGAVGGVGCLTPGGPGGAPGGRGRVARRGGARADWTCSHDRCLPWGAHLAHRDTKKCRCGYTKVEQLVPCSCPIGRLLGAFDDAVREGRLPQRGENQKACLHH